MTNNLYKETVLVRDRLSNQLRRNGVKGFVGVGIGKSSGGVCLVVSIDDNVSRGDIPSNYDGYEVVVKNMGVLSFHGFGVEEEGW